ncbi:MAG: FxLYD domain-containing protein [Heliobacteriaceae bacterium]|jgi:hypothetical protein|nr:FxLYD domain-containing protein [Heliobacteriaceae bacterium]
MEKTHRKIIIAINVIAILFLIWVELAFRYESQPEQVMSISKLELLEHNKCHKDNICGKIRNTGTDKEEDIYIMFNLYNSNGELIGNASEYLKSLEPSTEWTFEIKAPRKFDSYRRPAITTKRGNTKPEVELLKNYKCLVGGVLSVCGNIRNNSSDNINIYLEYDLYDFDGRKIGKADAFVNNVEPGGIWHFTAKEPKKSSGKFAAYGKAKIERF